MAGFGLRSGRSQGMDGYTGNLAEFPIDPANTNTIFTGDVVVLSSGFVEEASGNTPGAIAAGPILGVFQGWRDKASKAVMGARNIAFGQYWSGAAGPIEPVASVSLPPHSTFHVRGAAGTTYTQASIGARYLLTYAAGDPNTGMSAVSLGAANAAGPVRILRLVDLPNNTFGSVEPIFEVSVIAQSATAADVA